MWQDTEGVELGVCGTTKSNGTFVHKFHVDSFYIQDTGDLGQWDFAAQTDYGLVTGVLKWEQGENEWVPYQLAFNSESKRLEAAIYFSEERSRRTRSRYIEREEDLIREFEVKRMAIEATITFALALPNPISAFNNLAS